LPAKKTSRPPAISRQPVSSTPITVSSEGAVNIRLSGLEMPDRVFNANWVSYDLQDDRVDLIFGQSVRGRTRLVSALVVSITKERAVIHFDLPISPSEGRFVSSLRQFVSTSGGSARKVEAVTDDALPDDRIAFESASVFGAAYSGAEAEIGFLKLSPWDLHRFTVGEHKGEIAFPVVRVFLGTDLLLGLVESLTRELSGEEGKHS
jgi:hypothetical protein